MSVQSSYVILCKYRWLWGFQRAFGSFFQTLKISDPAFFNYFQLCFSPEGPLKKYLRELVILPPCKIQRWIRKSQPFHSEKNSWGARASQSIKKSSKSMVFKDSCAFAAEIQLFKKKSKSSIWLIRKLQKLSYKDVSIKYS